MKKTEYTQSGTMFAPPAPNQRTISLGDRVFVRLTMTTGERFEFYTTNCNGLSEVIGELRYRTRKLRGLGKVWIRNMSCGWATERPIKLYGSIWRPATVAGQPGTFRLSSAPVPAVRNLGPWETH